MVYLSDMGFFSSLVSGFQTVVNRLSEPSTYAGTVGMLGSGGFAVVADGHVQMGLAAAGMAAALFEIVRPEGGRKASAVDPQPPPSEVPFRPQHPFISKHSGG